MAIKTEKQLRKEFNKIRKLIPKITEKNKNSMSRLIKRRCDRLRKQVLLQGNATPKLRALCEKEFRKTLNLMNKQIKRL